MTVKAEVDAQKRRARISAPTAWDAVSIILALTVLFSCGGIPEIVNAVARADARTLALGGIILTPGLYLLSRRRAAP